MTQPTMRSAIQMPLIATALVAAWSDQGRAQQQDAKPAYCTGAGAYRLPEYGLTEKEALEAEAAAARSPAARNASMPRGPGTAAASQWSCKVSAAGFAGLRTGMSYTQATSRLGCTGEEVSRSELAGHLTIMYRWRGDGLGANMNAMFQNDALVSKAQAGLR